MNESPVTTLLTGRASFGERSAVARQRSWLVIALGALLTLPPAAWSADDAASGSEQPPQEAPAPLLGDDGRYDRDDDPTSDTLERWRDEDREEHRDERLERREQRQLERRLDERFGNDAPAD